VSRGPAGKDSARASFGSATVSRVNWPSAIARPLRRLCGGLAVISDVFRCSLRPFPLDQPEQGGHPASSIDKAPSAELRPDQTDQDSLPPYEMLDAILKGYVEEGLSRADLVAQGFDQAVVNDIVRKVDLNEYKRKQAPPA